MNKEIGNVEGVSIMVNPETYEIIKKRKTIYENKILMELQQRIDKAIKYMNNYNELVIPTANIKSLVLKEEYKKIINILQGENNEK